MQRVQDVSPVLLPVRILLAHQRQLPLVWVVPGAPHTLYQADAQRHWLTRASRWDAGPLMKDKSLSVQYSISNLF